MIEKPLAQSCKYEPSMVCFSGNECKFENQVECLKQALFLCQRELAGLKEKANQKHSRMSLKWRDSAFYFKKRSKALETYIKASGLEVPLTYEKEGEDDRMADNSKENGTISSGSSGGVQE